MSPYLEASRDILVVEDNPGDVVLIREMLSGTEAHRIRHAPNLRGALEALRDACPDVLLLDLHLPDASGVETVRRVREEADDVPIVVLTGLDDDALALDCLAAGAQDYVAKEGLDGRPLLRSMAYAIARLKARAAADRAAVLQERLAAIVEASRDAIVSCAQDGRIESWNRGAERIFQIPREEAIGQPLHRVLRDPQARDGGAPAAPAGADPPAEEPREVVRLRGDGSRVDLSVLEFSLRDVDGGVAGRAAIYRDITVQKRRDEELRTRNAELVVRDDQLRALISRLTAVREEERTRISREVHDELGQLLTGIKMDLRWIERRLVRPDPPDAAALVHRLHEAGHLVDRTIGAVQRIAIELRPSALDALGLSAAIRDEARRFEERTDIVVHVDVETPLQPREEAATALFRVFQELLTNVARHAAARSVTIRLRLEEGCWILVVEDDGVGIEGDARESPTALGLLGIGERARQLGGSFTLVPKPGRGSIATVVLAAEGDRA